MDKIKNIPKEIVNLKRFVGYNTKKCPLNVRTGNNANPVDSNTWGTYEEAIQSVSKFKHVIGIGLVLGKVDGKTLCGFDIDDCIDSDGNIAKEAQKAIDKLDTYTELSPSGKGIHCLFYASKKGLKCKNNKLSWCKCVEIYDSNRYFTLTGNQLYGKGIEHRQAECNYIYDTYFESQSPHANKKRATPPILLDIQANNISDEECLAIGLKKDTTLKSYLNGNRQSEDESSNDMGLMSKLMYWCNNNIDLAIETFKNSTYAKQKTGKHIDKMDRDDYLKITAEKCKCETAAVGNKKQKKTNIIERQETMQDKIDIIEKRLHSLEKASYKYDKDDKGNGELYADVFKDELRYNITFNQWMYFNGKYWVIDSGGLVTAKYAKHLKDALMKYSINCELNNESNRSEVIDSFQKHIINLGKRKIRENMIKDARDKFPINKSDLDKNIYQFNCLNGTLNLQTFKFEKHRAEDFISKISNVEYNQNIASEQWENVISDIMQNDREKIRFLQKALGYALTGDTSKEACFIFYGPKTRNGKSTITETYNYLLNNYARQINPSSLAKKQTNSQVASGDIARLDGARFVNVSEPDKGMVIDEALLKKLTGRDTITARNLYEREFQFIPEFKLFMNTNSLPQVSDDTLFKSGRINVIPFDRHFKPEEQDSTLKDKLKQPEALSSILNWCIEGLRMFYNEGLKPPESIINATREYQEDNDNLSKFIKDCLIPYKENTSGKESYDVYKHWCNVNSCIPEGKRSFFTKLKDKNILKDSGTVKGNTVKNAICGYSIAPEWQLNPQ